MVNPSPANKKGRDDRKPSQSRLYLLETMKVFRGAENSIVKVFNHKSIKICSIII